MVLVDGKAIRGSNPASFRFVMAILSSLTTRQWSWNGFITNGREVVEVKFIGIMLVTDLSEHDLLQLLRKAMETIRPDLSGYMKFPLRGKVVAVDAQKFTVDVQPDDPDTPLLPKCQILTLWATATQRIVVLPKVDDSVVVGFMWGDPTQPFVMGFVSETGSGEKHFVIEQGKSRIEMAEDGALQIATDVTLNVTAGAKITINGDADIDVIATGKVKVSAPHIELGASAQEKVVLGDSFKTFFNTHIHTGNLGAPTSPPIQPMMDSLLSQVSKTE